MVPTLARCRMCVKPLTHDGHATHHESMNQMTESPAIPKWTLGWRLQRSLAHAGIGVQDMARELGVSRSTISRWMNDRGASPRSIYLRQWAAKCGVPLDFITLGEWSRRRLAVAA